MTDQPAGAEAAPTTTFELLDAAAKRGHSAMTNGELPAEGDERDLWHKVALAILNDPNLLPACVHAAEVRAERDQLKARIDKALELHTEFKIYDECGHKHTAEDVDAGRAIKCAGHTRPCWPCPTVAALQGDQSTEPAWTQASTQAPNVQASGEAREAR